MVWINQEKRRKYWATRASVCSFARTAHSFACSGLHASLAPSAALTHLLARSLRSLPHLSESEFIMSQTDLVLSHSALTFGLKLSHDLEGVFRVDADAKIDRRINAFDAAAFQVFNAIPVNRIQQHVIT